MIGSQLGPYEIVAEIGRGGMANLYLARRRGPGGFSRRVAIKIVHPELANDGEVLHMFLDEARLSACIHHPNVVHVEELGEQGGVHYLVMEHIDGVTFADVLRGFIQRRQLMPAPLAIAIAARIAEGLHAAHESSDEHGDPLSIVHRDVSPQNILVGALGHVKLIDFGIAKARDRLARTRTGSVKGKLAYMSPEQLRGDPIDRRTDVFSLGVLVWEALTLRRLFLRANDLETILAIREAAVDPPSRYRSDLPPNLDYVIQTALARELDERFSTAAAVRRAMLIACPEAQAVEASALGDLVRDVAGEAWAKRRSLAPDDTVPGKTRSGREDV